MSGGDQEAELSKPPDRGFYGSAVVTLEFPGRFLLRRWLAEAIQQLDEGRGSKDSLSAFEVLDGEPRPFPRNQEVGASDECYFARLEVILLTFIAQAYSGAVVVMVGLETSTSMRNVFRLTLPPDFLRVRLPRGEPFAISPSFENVLF